MAEEKIKFLLEKITDLHGILIWAINRLIKEGNDEPPEKTYYPVPSLLLCFCFLDFLKRFNYIWENGKNGQENCDNALNYKLFLNSFIIDNKEYIDKEYSFTAKDLYSVRTSLVHEFCLKEFYNRNYISFVDGKLFEDRGKINEFRGIISKQKKINLENIKIIIIRDFLLIIKCGIKKMFDKYEADLMLLAKNRQELPPSLDDLYEELKQNTYFYLVKNPPTETHR